MNKNPYIIDEKRSFTTIWLRTGITAGVLLLLLCFLTGCVSSGRKTDRYIPPTGDWKATPTPTPFVPADFFVIDDFEDGDDESALGTKWGTVTDSSNEGLSTITPDTSQNETMILSAPGFESEKAIGYTFTLDRGDFLWDPYVSLYTDVTPETFPVDTEELAGITFDYKGYQHIFVIQTTGVVDYANYQIHLKASEEWRRIFIPWSDLKQPFWGRPVEFKPEEMISFHWQVMGKTGETGELLIDNVQFILKGADVANTENTGPVTNDFMLKPAPAEIEPPEYLENPAFGAVTPLTWKEGKKGALALSFDDGLLSHFEHTKPVLDRYGLKATFYVLTDSLANMNETPGWRFGYWDHFITLTEEGHELGGHDGINPLTSMAEGDHETPNTVHYSLARSIQRIGEEIPDYKTITYAYPFTNQNTEIQDITANYYYAARGLGDGVNPAEDSKIEWMNLNSKILEFAEPRDKEVELKQLSAYQKWLETKIVATGKWSIFLAHDVIPFDEIADAGAWHPLSVSWFDTFCAWLKKQSDTGGLWIATVGDITRYIKERDNLKWGVVSESDSEITIHLADGLDDQVFDMPLSLEITVPADWQTVSVEQNGKIVAAEAENGKIVVAVVPQGLVSLKQAQ